MCKYQIKNIPKNMFSSLSLAWAYTSIIVFLLLDIESVEARLIWIPHGKDIKEDSPTSYDKAVASKREKMVDIEGSKDSKDLTIMDSNLSKQNMLQYSSINKLCQSIGDGDAKHIIKKSRRTVKFSVQFYNRLDQLITKGFQTFSRECKHQNPGTSVLLKHLMKNSETNVNSRKQQKEESNRCKNIRMVLKYAQKLLCR